MTAETKYPLVSVIMPCYKMGRFIGEALESVGKQTYTNWEVIAVDDCGPEDGTREAVKAFAKKFPDNRVIYHRHEKNAGVSASRNTAISSSLGKYLAFLDPDDVWPNTDYLEIKVNEIIETNSDVTYGSVIFIDENCKKLGEFQSTNDFEQSFPTSLYRKNEIYLSTTLARKDAVIRIGGFDTTPEIQHVEDWDLWIRLALCGCRFLNSKAGSVCYRRHGGGASSCDERMWHLSSLMIRRHIHHITVKKARSGIREVWEKPPSNWHPIIPKKVAHWLDCHPRLAKKLKMRFFYHGKKA